MDLPVNVFKRNLAEGARQIGLWSQLANNIAAEIISRAGFDWIVLDMEHGPNELPALIAQLQAMTGGSAEPVVRPPWNDMVVIKRVLDAGCRTLLIPYVQNADEAEQAVAAARYPGAGKRGVAGGTRASGYGRIANYLGRASDEICVLVQVETETALNNIEEIAAVDGVDGIFIGPSDLSASMGYLDQRDAEPVQKAIREAARRIVATGKAPGILGTVEDDARRYIDWGFTFVAVGSDAGLLVKSTDALAVRFKQG